MSLRTIGCSFPAQGFLFFFFSPFTGREIPVTKSEEKVLSLVLTLLFGTPRPNLTKAGTQPQTDQVQLRADLDKQN